jgi:hypothetical protein
MSSSNRAAIMQPYFLPYLGYWQLMANVEEFVVYDDIQFTKKGWIHRNRYLNDSKDQLFTLPLKKDSDYLDVFERYLSESWHTEREKLYRKLKGAYQKAPYFQEIAPLVEDCLFYDSTNLFDFTFNSIKKISQGLGINTKLLVSSQLGNTKHLKGQDRVLKICELIEATEYVNPIGGKELYKKENFSSYGIDLKFHQIDPIIYSQFGNDFIPNLSIIDVLMFCGMEKTENLLSCCKIHE